MRTHKHCPVCNRTLPWSAFGQDLTQSIGIKGLCDEFSIYEKPGLINYCQYSGSSDPYCWINVMVDGMPPMPGRTGPGIRLYAENEEQLKALHAWIVGRLQA